MADNEKSIVIDGVHKKFGGTEVLKGVSLSIAHGEVICIIGPSGSGKSTLIRCINGLTPIDGGTITVHGHTITAKSGDLKALRRDVGIVFQQYNLFPHKTVIENITLSPIIVLHRPREEAIKEAKNLLEQMQLSDKADAYPGELSGGQQQRVAIARSLAMKPRVMLFDEITAALDPLMVKEVLNLVRRVAESGVTCVIVTHEMQFAREVADYVYFTSGGRIIEAAPPEILFTSAREELTREFLSQLD